MLESRSLPPRLPVQDPGDYRWAAADWTDEAHAFPPVVEGQLQKLAPCGARWTVRYGYEGTGHCLTCVAALRDQLRAITVALAAAGIQLDQADASPGLRERLLALLGPSHPHDEGLDCGTCAAYNLLAVAPTDDQRGDHFAGMD